VLKKYNVTFPLYSKISVNGKQTHPIYLFLRAKINNMLGSSIKWNWTKFIINRAGIPVHRAGPPSHPLKLESIIVDLLKEPEPKN